jgi:hypothetical protein
MRDRVVRRKVVPKCMQDPVDFLVKIENFSFLTSVPRVSLGNRIAWA